MAHDTFDVESGTMFGMTDRASVCEAERENTAIDEASIANISKRYKKIRVLLVEALPIQCIPDVAV
jgi:hypothetical protein